MSDPGRGSIWRYAWPWFCAAVVLRGIAAYRSEGFYHPDEHFQILEFMNAHLGRSSVRDLPWEYAYRMREWIQPWVFAQYTRLFELLGISNPFAWAFLFRLTTAMLSLMVLWGLISRLPGWISSLQIQKWVVIGLCTLWVIVFRDVHPSSESWSGDFFMLALLLSGGERNHDGAWKWVAIGGLLGLAFEFRYPSCLLIFGLALWHAAIRRTRLRWAAFAGGGFVAVVLAALVLDRLGYGAWVFPPWDFVYQNIVLGKSKQFSNQPWWWYLERFSVYYPPLSTSLLILSLVGLTVRRTHVLTWSFVPYLIVHFLLSDKQLRFFFPVISFVPIFCGFAAEWVARVWSAAANRVWRVLKPVLVVENIAALAIVTLSMSTQQVPFWRVIYTEARAHPGTVLYAYKEDPYKLGNLKANYYRSPDVKVAKFHDWRQVKQDLKGGRRTVLVWVHYTHSLWNLNPRDPALESDCRLRQSTVPVWIMRIDFSAYTWIHRKHWWTLYECSN